MHPDPCLIGVAPSAFDSLVQRLTYAPRRCRGRPWSLALPARIQIACMYLRTNLTVRELAAVCSISKSHVHRILSDVVPRIAARFVAPTKEARHRTWIVDGTLVPTRDHLAAAKSKNHRWS